jgi:hypothetical protein
LSRSLSVSVRLPEELLGQIDGLAEEERRTRGNMVRNVLGIAFDLLCWKFKNVGGPISQEIFDLIADAGSRMGCSPQDWQKLQLLVR